MFDVKWIGISQPYTIVADEGGVNFSLGPGVSPSSGTFYVSLNYLDPIPRIAMLQMSDGMYAISMEICATESREELDTSATTRPITFVDRRWKWKYADVTGVWNQADANGNLPVKLAPGEPEFYKGFKRNAQELVTDCLEAMGETVGTTAYVTNIPTDVYPPVTWYHANAAKALQEVLDEIGGIICLGYDDKATCYLLNASAFLPTAPYERYESGDKIVEHPEVIRIVGGRIIDEEEFTYFEAVGLDTDGSVKKLDDLSYAPGVGAGRVADWDSGVWGDFWDLLDYPDAMACAQESVYKWFRIVFDTTDAENNAALAAKKLPFLSYISKTSKAKAADPSGVTDEYTHDPPKLRMKTSLFTGNNWFKASTADDAVAEGWSLDAKAGIIKFSQPQMQPIDASESSGGYEPPDMTIRCAYASNERNEYDCYFYDYIPSWPGVEPVDTGLVHTVHVPELVLFRIDGSDQNGAELDRWALARAQDEMKKFDASRDPEGKTYVGLVQVSPNAGIRSVAWTINGQGATTTVELGYETPKDSKMTYREKLNVLKNWRKTAISAERDRERQRKEQDDQ